MPPRSTDGPWIKVYERALDEPRIKLIGRKLQLSEFDVLGRFNKLWALCYRRRSAFLRLVDAEIVTGELPGFIAAAIAEEMADLVDESTLRIRGAEDAIASLLAFDALSELNSGKGKKSGESRRQKSEELQKRTAVQTGLDFGSEPLPRSGSEHSREREQRDQIPERDSDQNHDSLLLSGSGPLGDEGAPPPLKIEPGASQDGFQPRKPAPPEAVKLATLLLQLVTSNNPGSRLAHGNRRLHNATITRWADQIRKLHETDHMPWPVIEEMIRWCQADNFWRTIILGAENLRERWDSMGAQRNRKASPTENRSKQRPGPTELAMRDAAEERSREITEQAVRA